MSNHFDHNNNASQRQSISEDRLSMIVPEQEEVDLLPDVMINSRIVQKSRMPRPSVAKGFPSYSSASVKSESIPTSSMSRPSLAFNSIRRRSVQGVLIRLFRNGEAHHPGVKIAVNEFDLKSWEAFLNYLNAQKSLAISSGGIRHIYTLDGREVRSLDKFQHRQSYVIASGSFLKTNYLHAYDTLPEENELNNRSRAPGTINDQIFILPYSQLNAHESLILNRNLMITFENWLADQVTNLLCRFLGNEPVTHLYAVTKFTFSEVKSFSQFFNLLKMTETFIACTDVEFEHSKRYLATLKSSDFLVNFTSSKKAINGYQRLADKQIIEEDQLSINWIYGYDGGHEQRRILHTVGDNEILYVIGSICILYQPVAKQQRFYLKHNNAVTNVTTHRFQPLIASSENHSLKDRSSVVVHIWNPINLEMLNELRREQFGSDLVLLSFCSRSEENLISLISRDKPKLVHILDWQRNELMLSINCKSDATLSVTFVFNSKEWVACVSEQQLTFYEINWNSKPIRVINERDAEVQNIYTGAMISQTNGERFIVGDQIGNIYVWSLVDRQPKLLNVREMLVEDQVKFIGSIDDELIYLANGKNQIKIWNIEKNEFKEIRIDEKFGWIQSICYFQQEGRAASLAIGTTLNFILQRELDSSSIEVIARGHIYPPTWLCANKNASQFFSVSSDRYLMKWNEQTRSVEWSIRCPQLISCADLHPERNIIVLGTETSKLLIYDSLTSFYIATIPVKNNAGVKTVRFSPDGQNLAVGLQNATVSLLEVFGNGDFRLRHEDTIESGNFPVADVIWSMDSKYLLTVYGNNNYCIWSLPSFTIHQVKNIHDIPWQSEGHPMISNILDKSIVDSHLSAIVLSSNMVLCTGRDGQLRLFRHAHERHIQTLNFGFGLVHYVIPSPTDKFRFLLASQDYPSIAEVQLSIENPDEIN